MHSPLFEIGLAMCPDGRRARELGPHGGALRGTRRSDCSIRPDSSGSHREASPSRDSAGLLGEVMVVFDAMGDVLVARREVQRGQECLNGDFTPERWAWWWIGQDHRASGSSARPVRLTPRRRTGQTHLSPLAGGRSDCRRRPGPHLHGRRRVELDRVSYRRRTTCAVLARQAPGQLRPVDPQWPGVSGDGALRVRFADGDLGVDRSGMRNSS